MYFFSQHTPRGSLDPQSYALYKAAKGIWNGGLDIHPLELEDLDLILAVAFFGKLGLSYFDYRKRGQFEWTGPVILFACLVFVLTLPT